MVACNTRERGLIPLRMRTDRQKKMRMLGIRLADIAEDTGMSVQLISALVRGKHPASLRLPEIDDFLERTRRQRIVELAK